uniref:Uncharacterized protein n=1 Tax=Cyanistes caeruleus TaxID=156563 RepID=A0A8C0UVR3_CYACU
MILHTGNFTYAEVAQIGSNLAVLLRFCFNKERNVLFCGWVLRGVTLIVVSALACSPLPSQEYSLSSPGANWKCSWMIELQGCKKGHLCLRGRNVFKQQHSQLGVVQKSWWALIQPPRARPSRKMLLLSYSLSLPTAKI